MNWQRFMQPCARGPRDAGTGAELRTPGAAAQTRICADISEFESYLAVWSLWGMSGWWNYAQQSYFPGKRRKLRRATHPPADLAETLQSLKSVANGKWHTETASGRDRPHVSAKPCSPKTAVGAYGEQSK
jgi:hypothetical protein